MAIILALAATIFSLGAAMKPPSRRMYFPPVPPPTVGEHLLALSLLACPLGLMVWSACIAERGRWIFGALALLYAIFCFWHWRRRVRIKAERAGESICTFARAIGARRRDTWIVRAVYVELGNHAGFPIRPTDKVYDLGFCDEDLDDAGTKIARLAGRSLEGSERNPRFDRVVTVADVVAFMEYQPLAPPLAGGG